MLSILNHMGLFSRKPTLKAIKVTRNRRDPRPKKRWEWDGLVCFAHTKSEARAEFKQHRQIKRLPIGAIVTQR